MHAATTTNLPRMLQNTIYPRKREMFNIRVQPLVTMLLHIIFTENFAVLRATCRRIEQLTREAVSKSFANEIGSGALQMKVINVEEPQNSHFSKDYKLFTRSVVVSDMVNEKEKQWKNLQKVWELVHDEKAFKEDIRSEIKDYLL